jgi:hypothetical protein
MERTTPVFLARLTSVSQFGFDFTVYGNDINVTSALVFASNGTLATNKSVTIFDRSTDVAVVRVDLAAGTAGTVQQQNNRFAQAAVDVVLRPGVYAILVEWNGVDLCAKGMPGTGTEAVFTTAAIVGSTSSATVPFVTSVVPSANDLLGVTFRFTVIPNAPPPLTVATEFADCEAVACAGLPTGDYSVGGKRTFCDNDEAGGGWTRIWRLNDSSCEANGWTSSRNIHANGTDPVGCRSGSTICQTIRLPNNAFAEVMGKNWKVWAFGSLDSFATGDGVFLSAETQRLWTFSLSHNIAVPQFRCPCNLTFSSKDDGIIQRINETGGDYVCDAAVRSDSFVQVFQGTGPHLCSPRGAGRLFFQKVLTEEQRRLPLLVMICKNQVDADEDIKVGALDLFARKTPGFEKTIHCPTTTVPPATTTTAAKSATSTILTSASGVVQQATTESPTDSNVAVIAGAVGGSIGAVLIAAAIAFVLRRKLCRQTEAKVESSGAARPPSGQSESEYGQLTLSAATSNYDIGRVTLPPAND